MAASLVVLGMASTAWSQPFSIWEFQGQAAWEGVGLTVAGGGDVDADGFSDVLVRGGGGVTAYGGATGSLIFVLNDPAPYSPGSIGSAFGFAIADAGDVNGDGHSDIVVGAQWTLNTSGAQAGAAYVFSGADGGLLHTLEGSPWLYFGSSVAGLGDLDGDGLSDVIVGAIQYCCTQVAYFPGFAKVFSGADGSVLFLVNGTAPGDLFGTSVAGPGDVTGDGVPDFVVGAPQNFGWGIFGTGYAKVFSGADGSVWSVLTGTNVPDLFGKSLCGTGDVDGDGLADIAVGAPQLGATGYANTGTGYVAVFSGLSGTLLYLVSGASTGDVFGYAVTGLADVTEDGVPDFLVGAPQVVPPLGTGYAVVFSGADGSPVHTFSGSANEDRFGLSVSRAGDVNGDTLEDIVIGAPFFDLPGLQNAGQAKVIAVGVGIPAGSSRFGSGCAGSGGSVPVISAAGGSPSPGNGSFSVGVSSALPGTTGLLIAGSSNQAWGPLPLPVGLFGSCSLLVSPDVLIPVAIPGGGIAPGVHFAPVPIPANPSLVGLHAYFQWYVVDPGPVPFPGSMTRGLDVVVLP